VNDLKLESTGIDKEEEYDFLKSIFDDSWDDMDIKIYQILRNEGRITDTELAEELGTSITTARRRRTKLQDNEYLLVVAQLNLQETDMVYVDVLVEISNNQEPKKIDEFIEEAIRNVRIFEVTQYVDNNQLMLRFFEEDLSSINNHINDFLMNREIVKDYNLLPAARSPKAWNRVLKDLNKEK